MQQIGLPAFLQISGGEEILSKKTKKQMKSSRNELRGNLAERKVNIKAGITIQKY